MKEKELSKVTIVDVFEHMIDSGESRTILEAIRKERGKDKIVATQEEVREQRKSILDKLKKDNNNNESK